jgi:hypothetical protein
MCEICDPGTHMRCIRFSSEKRVWEMLSNDRQGRHCWNEKDLLRSTSIEEMTSKAPPSPHWCDQNWYSPRGSATQAWGILDNTPRWRTTLWWDCGWAIFNSPKVGGIFAPTLRQARNSGMSDRACMVGSIREASSFTKIPLYLIKLIYSLSHTYVIIWKSTLTLQK